MSITELMAKRVPECKVCNLSHSNQYEANFCCGAKKRSNKPIVYLSEIANWRNK